MARQGHGRRTDVAWDAVAHALVARDVELASVRHHLSTEARAVTVLGVAGAGKSSLLSTAASSAASQGWGVIRVRGRATETMLGFATLLDLIDSREVPDGEVATLADSIRRRVLGYGGGGTPEALTLRRDVHQWLLGLAHDAPLLVVVDDVQWVDPTSWLVLAFVANRVAQSQVSFLFASRAGTAPAGLEDTPVVHLTALRPQDAAELLDSARPTLDPLVRASIVDRAAGNPLALLELGRDPGGAASSDATALHTVPASIEAAFAADLPRLPEATRKVLLLAAAGGDDLTVLARAAGRPGHLARHLEPAERAGLVRVSGRQIVFRHPLIESTVYDLASATQRQQAHAALAGLYDAEDDRHVWHRAAAADGPDETVSAELMASAERMQRRGAQEEAAEAIVRAAELTADPDVRDDRMLIGVGMSSAVGHVHKILSLAEHFRRSSSHPVVRARAAQLHAYALAQTRQQALARDMLQVSLEESIRVNDEGGWASLTTLALLTYETCRGQDVLAQWLARYEATTSHDLEDHPVNAAARAFVTAAADPLARPVGLLQLIGTAPDLPRGDRPSYHLVVYDVLLGAAAWLLDEHPAALQRLQRAAGVMNRTRATQGLPQAVMALGHVHLDMGRYDEADHAGRLLVDLSEAHGLLFYRTVGRHLRARVAAVRGDHHAALKEIDALRAEIEPGQSVALEAHLATGRASALAALRDHEAAYQQLRDLFDGDGAPRHPHIAYRSLGDLAAAAVRLGRVEEVQPLVRAARERLAARPGERMTRVLARAQAHLADDSSAEALFERATHTVGAPIWPLEWANAQLDHGVWLRRHKRASDARDHLRSARQVFARIGAGPWVAVADAELRAAGVRPDIDDREAARWTGLTGQEREIVLLAADGLSNKEIGQALFLSSRTVGAHLYNAFPKLGVTSRTQLRDVVAELRQG